MLVLNFLCLRFPSVLCLNSLHPKDTQNGDFTMFENILETKFKVFDSGMLFFKTIILYIVHRLSLLKPLGISNWFCSHPQVNRVWRKNLLCEALK
jgi:hypothetical protein